VDLAGGAVNNQIDELRGGSNRDLFILGQTGSQFFYVDDGDNGFADILDYSKRVVDQIQLAGSASDYTIFVDGSDTIIERASDSDRIAIVRNATGLIPGIHYNFVG